MTPSRCNRYIWVLLPSVISPVRLRFHALKPRNKRSVTGRTRARICGSALTAVGPEVTDVIFAHSTTTLRGDMPEMSMRGVCEVALVGLVGLMGLLC